MADAFQPRFVDLVRSYTTTQGTGAFVLGDAVTGYRSFGSAIQPGETFYYSAIGVEKPAEHEVGRGTLQADGTISRDPVSGSLIDFSGGHKTIALVAAAEWYDKLQAVSQAAGARAAATRAELAGLAERTLPAVLHESGREGLFLFDASDRSADVAADPLQGLHVAAASDPTGASGAWVRRFSGPIDVRWFGTVADGAADDHAAIQAALTIAGNSTAKVVRLGAGGHVVSQPLSVPDGVTIEGEGRDTILAVTGSATWAISLDGVSHAVIRNMKLRGASTGLYRSGLKLNQCSHIKVEAVVVDDVADSSLLFAWDCDDCLFDDLYFDGGAAVAGYGAYLVGCRGCKVTNSFARRCSQGFAISGDDVDPESTRTTAEAFGNIIDACHVRECGGHSFNINAAVGNVISNCSAEDYSGSSNHWAFQTKDIAGDSTRANIIIGCTVQDYPSGFGAQEASHTQFIGCTAQNLAEYGFMLNSLSRGQVIGGNVHAFGVAGIYINSGTSNCTIDSVKLETSTVTAKGILMLSAGANNSNNFDHITTGSTLAAFIQIPAGSNTNRFGMGCRSNGNPIDDSSGTSVWPLLLKTDILPLNSVSSRYGAYSHRGMHVAVARFVVTVAVGGTPSVCAGRLGDVDAVAASQPVSGIAGTATSLVLTSQMLGPGSILSGTTAIAGTGEGYVQLEGLPA